LQASEPERAPARPPGAHPDPARESTAGDTRAIAAATVRAYKDALGRGPTKCTVHFAGTDTLVVTLEDTMTLQERKLASLGMEKPVREARLVLAGTLEERLRPVVERALGRRTVAFISGFDIARDVAVEVFTLASEAKHRY
jgi:uncharacterized protein YbcI